MAIITRSWSEVARLVVPSGLVTHGWASGSVRSFFRSCFASAPYLDCFARVLMVRCLQVVISRHSLDSAFDSAWMSMASCFCSRSNSGSSSYRSVMSSGYMDHCFGVWGAVDRWLSTWFGSILYWVRMSVIVVRSGGSRDEYSSLRECCFVLGSVGLVVSLCWMSWLASSFSSCTLVRRADIRSWMVSMSCVWSSMRSSSVRWAVV